MEIADRHAEQIGREIAARVERRALEIAQEFVIKRYPELAEKEAVSA
jgi:hypothetical protein